MGAQEILNKQDEWVNRFSKMPKWEDRYKLIISLGREHQGLDQKDKIDANKVAGCQSQVWIKVRFEEGRVYYDVDSDALIARGLVALMAQVYSGHDPLDIIQNHRPFIAELGLAENLSPSRANGVFSMLKKMKLYAFVFSQQQESAESH